MQRLNKRRRENKLATPERQPAAPKADAWQESVWGSREAFIQARMEKEGYTREAAESYADVWEDALTRLRTHPPQILRSA